MGQDTFGKIKGFVSHEMILGYIRKNWDKDASHTVSKRIICPVQECDFPYKFNSHSEDNENWYNIFGFISFTYHGEIRELFYNYNSINTFENLEYHTKHGLQEMVNSETTTITLGCRGSSVEIIKELVSHFGGGWIDENDCDEKEYYFLPAETGYRRKVLFTDGMSSDFLLIITDAPKEDIEAYCRYHNRMMEDGGHFEMFATLKTKYHVKELLDSEVDEKEDLNIIGFDEAYDFSHYYFEKREV